MRLRALPITSVLAVALGGAVSASSAAAHGATPSPARAARAGAIAITQPLAATASVSVPPELLAFEQAAEALHVNSIRFSASFEEDFSIPLSHSKTLPLDLPVQATGEESTVPRRAKIEIGVLGESTEARVIGETAYVRRLTPSDLGGVASGRTWTREAGGELARSTGVDPFSLGGSFVGSVSGSEGGGETAASGEAPAASSFAGLSKALATATSITDVGPELVDGAQATEFAATLEPATLLAKLSAQQEAELRKLGGKGRVTAVLDVFFAPNGLPVRTSWSVAFGVERIAASVDVLATEVPVEVQAPPADKTIAASRLKQLEAAKKKRVRPPANAADDHSGRRRAR